MDLTCVLGLAHNLRSSAKVSQPPLYDEIQAAVEYAGRNSADGQAQKHDELIWQPYSEA